MEKRVHFRLDCNKTHIIKSNFRERNKKKASLQTSTNETPGERPSVRIHWRLDRDLLLGPEKKQQQQ